MKLLALLLFVMLCLMPIVANSHSGREPHCNLDNLILPCYDVGSKSVIENYEEKPNEDLIIELVVSQKPKKKNIDHFTKWFDEGVLVCGSIHTDNPIAQQLLLDPSPEWRYGIPKIWKDDSDVQKKLKSLGNFYFCRYTFYK